jgi:hypothetical protein
VQHQRIERLRGGRNDRIPAVRCAALAAQHLGRYGAVGRRRCAAYFNFLFLSL